MPWEDADEKERSHTGRGRVPQFQPSAEDSAVLRPMWRDRSNPRDVVVAKAQVLVGRRVTPRMLMHAYGQRRPGGGREIDFVELARINPGLAGSAAFEWLRTDPLTRIAIESARPGLERDHTIVLHLMRLIGELPPLEEGAVDHGIPDVVVERLDGVREPLGHRTGARRQRVLVEAILQTGTVGHRSASRPIRTPWR